MIVCFRLLVELPADTSSCEALERRQPNDLRPPNDCRSGKVRKLALPLQLSWRLSGCSATVGNLFLKQGRIGLLSEDSRRRDLCQRGMTKSELGQMRLVPIEMTTWCLS